ncbi:MAG: hypothetical protein JO022_04640, partial [Acidobacteriaceae bacterium]|nr:hypothetical protein [Acidobacteriaceae bacterium]
MTIIDRYFEQTRSPGVELIRHFFAGLLQPESAGSDGSFVTWMVQILAVLVAASWYIPVQLYKRYSDLHAAGNAVAFQVAYVSDTFFALVTMGILISLVTVLEWQALFPSRKDQLILTPLPLTRLQLFGAKLAALLLFVTLFIAAITVFASLALPAMASGPLEPRSYSIRVAAMLTGTLGLSYFVFLALLAIQGLLLAILPLRWFESISFTVQVGLLVLLLCSFPLLPYFPAKRFVLLHPHWIDLFPPAWFLGLSGWVAGTRGPWVVSMAERALEAFSVAILLAATAYLVSYLQYNRYASETPRHDRESKLSLHSLFARCFRLPQSRATAGFILSVLSRGRQQKLVFLLIFGIGVALVLESSVYASMHPERIQVRGAPAGFETSIVSLPLTLSFFAMIGMRRVFRLPSELAANWIFRFTEEPELRRSQLDTVFWTFVFWGGL